MKTIWMVGRMQGDTRQIRSNPDGSAIAFNSKEEAEQYIAEQELGVDAFAFDAPVTAENVVVAGSSTKQ